MIRKKWFGAGLAVAGLLFFLSSTSNIYAADDSSINIYSSNSEFDDVIFELESELIDRGYKIDYRGYISKMMERTAQEFGGDKSVYKNAQFVTFCSVSLTRAMVKADPRNLAFCPYVIFTYELRSNPGQVFIGYRRPTALGSRKSAEATMAVDKLLDSIVKQVGK